MIDAGSVAMICRVCPLAIAAKDCLVRKIGNGHTKPRTSNSMSMRIVVVNPNNYKALCLSIGGRVQELATGGLKMSRTFMLDFANLIATGYVFIASLSRF